MARCFTITVRPEEDPIFVLEDGIQLNRERDDLDKVIYGEEPNIGYIEVLNVKGNEDRLLNADTHMKNGVICLKRTEEEEGVKVGVIVHYKYETKPQQPPRYGIRIERENIFISSCQILAGSKDPGKVEVIAALSPGGLIQFPSSTIKIENIKGFAEISSDPKSLSTFYIKWRYLKRESTPQRYRQQRR